MQGQLLGLACIPCHERVGLLFLLVLEHGL